jgi:hypothetical protein
MPGRRLNKDRFAQGNLLNRDLDEGCSASRTKFAAFAIIATVFRTAHIAPFWLRWFCSVRLCRLLGRVEALREPVVDVTGLRSSHGAARLTISLRGSSRRATLNITQGGGRVAAAPECFDPRAS